MRQASLEGIRRSVATRGVGIGILRPLAFGIWHLASVVNRRYQIVFSLVFGEAKQPLYYCVCKVCVCYCW